MAATEKGVWDLQEVRDKQLASEWSYDAPGGDPGQLWAWGRNEGAKLGLNDKASYSSPTQVGTQTTWMQVESGDGTYGRKSDGSLWSWGSSYYGQLGQNNTAPWDGGYSSPTQIGTDTTWTSNFGAMLHQAIATKSDNTLWNWGSNVYGMLGQNQPYPSHRSSPTQIPGTTWNKGDLGYYCGYATKTDGTLWSWGKNVEGPLGQNNQTEYSSPTQIGTDTTWSSVGSGGQFMIMATKTDGTLWAWGQGTDGQLGQNDTVKRSSPVQIPGTTWNNLSPAHVLNKCSQGAVKTDGTLWMWGANEYGEVGDNTIVGRSSPVQVPGTWDKFTLGQYNSIGRKDDGTLWMWGYNRYGKLGQNQGQTNTTNSYSSPVQIPGTWEESFSIGKDCSYAIRS